MFDNLSDRERWLITVALAVIGLVLFNIADKKADEVNAVRNAAWADAQNPCPSLDLTSELDPTGGPMYQDCLKGGALGYTTTKRLNEHLYQQALERTKDKYNLAFILFMTSVVGGIGIIVTWLSKFAPKPLLSPLAPEPEVAAEPARLQKGHPQVGIKRQADILDAEARHGPKEQRPAWQPTAERERNAQETQIHHTPAPKSKLDWSAKVDWGPGFSAPAVLVVFGLFLFRNWPPSLDALLFGAAAGAVIAIIFKLLVVWRAPRR
jgi:hypothetical protein